MRRLAGSPLEQAQYALHLLERDRRLQVVQAALAVLEEVTLPPARHSLLDRYAYFDAQGVKRDAGGFTRASVLRALRRVAKVEDVPLLERAATTYEFIPPGRSDEAGGAIRAAALLTLDALDPALAAFYAVRLLVDGFSLEISGEPGATAARLLASHGQLLPLYERALQPVAHQSELLAEVLRNLVELPASLLPALIAHLRGSQDEIVLVGLVDLLAQHEAGSEQGEALVSFLRETRLYGVYGYAVKAIVASHREALLALLPRIARDEDDERKRRSLAEAVALLEGRTSVGGWLAELRAAL